MLRHDFRFQISFHVEFNLRGFWTRTNLGETDHVKVARAFH